MGDGSFAMPEIKTPGGYCVWEGSAFDLLPTPLIIA